jgi:hypothetical protein
LLLLLELLFIEKDIALATEAIIQLYPDITPPMFGEYYISIAEYILGIIQSQFHHGSNHVLKTIRASKGSFLRDLLDSEKCSVGM